MVCSSSVEVARDSHGRMASLLGLGELGAFFQAHYLGLACLARFWPLSTPFASVFHGAEPEKAAIPHGSRTKRTITRPNAIWSPLRYTDKRVGPAHHAAMQTPDD